MNMACKTYITVKGEVNTYPKYHNKRSNAKYTRVKCPICKSLCLTIFHKKGIERVILGYICYAHAPPHVFIDGKYKIFDVKVN